VGGAGRRGDPGAGGRIIAGERVPDEIVEQAMADLATG
jgi:hypothetical protein